MGIATRTTSSTTDQDPARTNTGEGEPHRCDGCGRTPLIGESIAHYKSGAVRCDLCRSVHREQPVSESLVKHSPDGPRSRVRVIRRLPA